MHRSLINQKNKLMEYALILVTETPNMEKISTIQSEIDLYQEKWSLMLSLRHDVEYWMNKRCIELDIEEINRKVLKQIGRT